MKVYAVVINDGIYEDIQKIFDSEEKAQAYLEANSYLFYDRRREENLRVPNNYKIGIFEDWADKEMYYIEYDVE